MGYTMKLITFNTFKIKGIRNHDTITSLTCVLGILADPWFIFQVPYANTNKDSFLEQVAEGLGYVAGVRRSFLRILY